MKDTQDKIGYCQLSLGLLYEDSTEYDNSGEVYPTSKQEISHTKNTNRFDARIKTGLVKWKN